MKTVSPVVGSLVVPLTKSMFMPYSQSRAIRTAHFGTEAEFLSCFLGSTDQQAQFQNWAREHNVFVNE
jgi:hypothetical protein